MPEGTSNYWSRARLSRRRALRGGALGVAGFAGAALIGCGGDDGEESGGSDSTAGAGGASPSGTAAGTAAANLGGEFEGATYGGIYIRDTADEPISLDNHTQEIPGSVEAANQSYEHLLRRYEDFEKEPGKVYIDSELAAEWEQVDELTVSFTLQEGVTWQDLEPVNGRAFTSEDVKYNIERMTGDNPELRTKTSLDPVSEVQTPDEKTVILKTSEPFAGLINNIGHTWAVMMPHELADTDEVQQRSVGTGAFLFREWQRGVQLTWDKNPNYWRKGHPFVDGVQMRIIPEESAHLANFRAGETLTWSDSYTTTPREVVEGMIESMPDTTFVETPSGGSITKIAMDTSGPPFDDIRVRQAIKFGLPYSKMIEIFDGLAQQTGPIVPLNIDWALPDEELADTDMAKAQQLMSSAGFGPDNPLRVTTRVSQFYSGPAVSQIVQAMLKPMGVEVNIEIMENAEWIAKVYRAGQDYQMSSHGDWAFEDPDRGLFSYFHSTGVANNTHYASDVTDDLLEKQRAEFDFEQRQQYVYDIQRQLIEDAPQVWLISTGAVQAARPEIHNFKTMVHGNSNEYRQYDNVWITT